MMMMMMMMTLIKFRPSRPEDSRVYYTWYILFITPLLGSEPPALLTGGRAGQGGPSQRAAAEGLR
jgi:hypothetical protein